MHVEVGKESLSALDVLICSGANVPGVVSRVGCMCAAACSSAGFTFPVSPDIPAAADGSGVPLPTDWRRRRHRLHTAPLAS